MNNIQAAAYIQPEDFALVVMLLGFLGAFLACATLVYCLLLIAFAQPHRSNGYTFSESLNKARKELA